MSQLLIAGKPERCTESMHDQGTLFGSVVNNIYIIRRIYTLAIALANFFENGRKEVQR